MSTPEEIANGLAGPWTDLSTRTNVKMPATVGMGHPAPALRNR